MNVYSLGKLGVDYERELSSELKRALFDRLLELDKQGIMLTEQGISNILLGLAKMEAKYAELPVEVSASLLRSLYSRAKSLKEQNIANSIYR